MPGQIAQRERGAVVLVEQRFFGHTNPRNDLSVKSFEVNTIDQAVEDFRYFARNVMLPIAGGSSVGPGETPWIIVGPGYAGALAAWAMLE